MRTFFVLSKILALQGQEHAPNHMLGPATFAVVLLEAQAYRALMVPIHLYLIKAMPS